ncbi:MAG: excisionase family DNA-binding protein [FCB group bacterium]|nr:excisionase family DNA-binding protein [FCB group bacterium]
MAKNNSTRIDDKEYFTTGEAARLCAVTPNTVLKWVMAGKIPASRTPGGHHRIHRSDIEAIGRSRLSVPRRLETNISKPFQFCWEYNSKGGNLPKGCRECIVYRSRSGRCFEMANLPTEAGHAKLFCQKSCEDCEYYEMVRGHLPNLLIVTNQTQLQSTLLSQVTDFECNMRFTSCEYQCSMMIESFRPDYLVVDCSFGLERSRELALHLSEDPRIPYARIILVGEPNGFPQECDHMVFGFVTRPFTMDVLSEMIGGLQGD